MDNYIDYIKKYNDSIETSSENSDLEINYNEKLGGNINMDKIKGGIPQFINEKKSRGGLLLKDDFTEKIFTNNEQPDKFL